MLAAPQAMASKFPAIVHVYTDVLRVLANAPAPMTATQLAAATRRDKSNVRRDLKKLEEAGVLTLDSEGAFVTDEGVAWVRGQAIAEGLESAGPRSDADAAPPPRAGHANFRPNPDQPRKDFDEAVIRGIADTIAADAENGGGGLLQALLVRPRDPADPLDGDEANPVRMIWAGEQRWRAIALLIAEDRLPAALDPARGGGIPFDERAEPPGGASFLALVENGARSDLDPLDEAFAFLDYVTRENLSARQAAINTGRAAKGEGGVRTVQIRVQVAKEATPEAIAEYRRTRDWNALVDSVQKAGETPEERRHREIRKGVAGLMGRRRLGLIELAHKALLEPDGEAAGRSTAIRRDLNDPTGVIGALVQHAGAMFGGGSGRISDVARAWLVEQKLLDIDNPRETLAAAWREHGLLETTIEDRLAGSVITWSTEWLNPPPPAAAPEEPALFDPPAAAPARTLADILPGRSVITLAEILHLSPGGGDDDPSIPQAQAAKYWLDGNLAAMKDAGLIVIIHEPGRPPVIGVTGAGLDAYHAALAERGVDHDGLRPSPGQLQAIRGAWGQAAWPGPGMVTEWLNIEPPAAPPAETADAAQAIVHTAARDVGPGRDESGAPSHEDLDDDEAREAAGRVRVEVDRAMVSLPVMGFARLMAAAGLGGALRTRPDMPGVVFDAAGEDILVIDQHGQLPDDLVHARATLVSAALNAANGAGVPLTLGDLVPDDDQSPAARLERALRRVCDWMAWHYEPLIAIPDAEAVYGQVSEALNAARAARRTEDA
jgi:hypothetical protein